MNIPELMELAVTRRASDVHLAPERSPAIRVDGALRPLRQEYPPLSAQECEDAIIGILRPDQVDTLRQNLEIDLSYSLNLPKGTTRFRVNVHRQQRGLGAIFRLIPDDIPSPEALTMEKSIFKFAELPRGLVLFTGATGTGKSTTLACLIEQINRRREEHILTVEDPIEYTYSEKRACITQRELGIHTHGFAPALKSALREDPDVILVGEMRDLETIQLALTASETGHLVFSTVHTSDTSQTVDRIIDVFPAAQQSMVRSQLSAVLQGIVTQVLMPRASGSGRIAAREILLATPAVRTMIRESNTHQLYNALTSGLQAGMCPLELSLAAKVRQKLITRDAAEAEANRPSQLRDYLASSSFSFSVPGLAIAQPDDVEDHDDLDYDPRSSSQLTPAQRMEN
ncbi:twitching motility protein PilT [Haloferula helveola]|uniref:Twitching motility protein PilT n=1 Tax=Haloferula helveola TaxID=490095 RepID=A0ABN6H1N2_9BACT|nr:twitching motility protein PilT [Haloferula helveola]